MKTKLALLLTSLACMAAANAAVLIAGFHDGDALAADGTGSQFTGNVQAQSPSISNVVVTLGSSLNLTASHYSQITYTTWGTQALDVAVPDSSGLNKSIITTNGALIFTVTITNNSAADLVLDQFHYAVKTDGSDAAKAATFAYVGGGHLGASSASVAADISGGVNAYDFSFGAGGLGLTDTTLSTGQTAQFTWTTGASTNSIRFDNLGISGAVVPEASTAALLGLVGLALIARRRR